MNSLLVFLFFVFGLIIGSFLNVVIYRLNTKKSLGGRSACMACRSKLNWYELIPVFSFLGLGGRCRSCKTKISMQYPLVEFASGIVFAFLYLKFKAVLLVSLPVFALTFFYYAFMFSLLLVIAVYDLKHKIIPDQLSLALGTLSFFGLFLFDSFGFHTHTPTLLEFSSGVLIALPFALLFFVSAGTWMGFGDAKLALGLGWFIGLSRALSGLLVAFWSGAIVGIILMFIGPHYKMKSEIPFAPFLVFSTLVAFIFEIHLFPI
jgi:leader peptidase (prepilin peptidase)/N-methyltransferase